MTKTRPGVDRITRQELTARATAAERELGRHLVRCFTCQEASGNVRARCGAWWELARTAHRARRALRRWQQPDTAGMDPLFTEEQCAPPPF